MARRAVAAVGAAEAAPEFIEELAVFADDPLGFVFYVFPWGEPGTALEKEEGPDDWQIKVLFQIGEAVKRNNALGDLAEAIRVAVASGHGIGKTTLVSWIIWWFISTRPHPQIVVTANTVAQLTTKTWRELAKWQKLARNGAWFQWSAQKLAAKWAPETWFASAVPWSKERAEAFAGTHEKHVLLIFDEASAIEDVIWEVAEGAMTTLGAMWVAFGNPTRNTGRFRECWRRFKARWFTLQVDSRTAKMANKKQLQAWLEDYGEDSDFFRVRVKGEFPKAASSQFIAEDDVEAACRRFERALRIKQAKAEASNYDPENVRLGMDDVEDESEPLILSVDVARFGDDDSVVVLRRGFLATIRARWNGLSTDQLAAKVSEFIVDLEPDAVFVDEVGIGAGVVDQLRALGHEVIGVNGAFKPVDERAYYNRRMEMWDLMRKWLRKGGMIERDQRLIEGLTAPEYGFASRANLMQLESKDDMKARGLPSPDEADALSMTFFQPVARRQRKEEARMRILAKLDAMGLSGTSFMSH